MPRLDAMVAEGRTGDAVKDFMRFVDVPGFGIAIMRLLPVWSKLKAVAPTLRYDFAFMADLQRGRPLPQTRWSTATLPTLVADGGKSPDVDAPRLPRRWPRCCRTRRTGRCPARPTW